MLYLRDDPSPAKVRHQTVDAAKFEMASKDRPDALGFFLYDENLAVPCLIDTDRRCYLFTIQLGWTRRYCPAQNRVPALETVDELEVCDTARDGPAWGLTNFQDRLPNRSATLPIVAISSFLTRYNPSPPHFAT